MSISFIGKGPQGRIVILANCVTLYKDCILTGFKNATLTSCYILQKTVECKLSLLL